MTAPALIGAIGRNPASLVVVGRHFGVRSALLVCTAQTAWLVPVLARQLDLPDQAVHAIRVGDDKGNHGIGEVRDKVHAALDRADVGAAVLDITGGTKAMSVGLYEAARAASLPRLHTVRLEPNGQLRDEDHGAAIPHAVTLEPAEFVEWYDGGPVRCTWRGPLARIPHAMRRRKRIGELILRHFSPGDGRPGVALNADGSARFPVPVPADLELPPGFVRRDAHTIAAAGRDASYFSKNGWLEELCLLRAGLVARDVADVRAALGLELGRDGSGSLDEADVVLTRGARVCVIEAKARAKGAGAGGEVNKRIGKAHRYFGSAVHVIFVHPAWGRRAPQKLVTTAGENTTLVGRDLRLLQQAVAAALGIPFDAGSLRHGRPQQRGRGAAVR